MAEKGIHNRHADLFQQPSLDSIKRGQNRVAAMTNSSSAVLDESDDVSFVMVDDFGHAEKLPGT